MLWHKMSQNGNKKKINPRMSGTQEALGLENDKAKFQKTGQLIKELSQKSTQQNVLQRGNEKQFQTWREDNIFPAFKKRYPELFFRVRVEFKTPLQNSLPQKKTILELNKRQKGLRKTRIDRENNKQQDMLKSEQKHQRKQKAQKVVEPSAMVERQSELGFAINPSTEERQRSRDNQSKDTVLDQDTSSTGDNGFGSVEIIGTYIYGHSERQEEVSKEQPEEEEEAMEITVDQGETTSETDVNTIRATVIQTTRIPFLGPIHEPSTSYNAAMVLIDAILDPKNSCEPVELRISYKAWQKKLGKHWGVDFEGLSSSCTMHFFWNENWINVPWSDTSWQAMVNLCLQGNRTRLIQVQICGDGPDFVTSRTKSLQSTSHETAPGERSRKLDTIDAGIRAEMKSVITSFKRELGMLDFKNDYDLTLKMPPSLKC
ncbi:hypothetical protein TSTA_008450 [Talaromyces stipitatus ATCC 10500]|uniref:Uncharacterized protein n=1 Tax=Talaromyces stipitatus (strain ATCC 10500 / CBS 375.48 / QM 6759 / NRRL 1006) TaxID=441959 RepID=B8MV93_TALSN|nr:uncharacterized protein TSTA_008450 [Talaromyces stipitatus ATCC 10500]EED11549.1 hypothetical protein TSTA_008450 [Talaromyces stipitatus ATCC 10500]